MTTNKLQALRQQDFKAQQQKYSTLANLHSSLAGYFTDPDHAFNEICRYGVLHDSNRLYTQISYSSSDFGKKIERPTTNPTQIRDDLRSFHGAFMQAFQAKSDLEIYDSNHALGQKQNEQGE